MNRTGTVPTSLALRPARPSRLRLITPHFRCAGPALLSGCAMDDQLRTPTSDEALIHVRLVDHIDYKPGTRAFGMSRCANGCAR